MEDTSNYADQLSPAVKLVTVYLQDKQAFEFTNIQVAKPNWHGNSLNIISTETTFDKALTIAWSGRSVYNYTGSDLYFNVGFKPATGNVSYMPLVRIRESNGMIHAFPLKDRSVPAKAARSYSH